MKKTMKIQSIETLVFVLISSILFIPIISIGQEEQEYIPITGGNGFNSFSDSNSSSNENAEEYTWCDVKKRIGMIAIEEYQLWGEKKESDPDMLENLVEYYYNIPGDPENLSANPMYQRVNWEELSSKAADNKVAWCAAFTSFVMRQAGIIESDGFEFSRRNLTFIVQAARNRYYHSSDSSKLFWLFDIDEPYAKLEVGDILCMNRKRRKNDNWSKHSFNSLINHYPQGTSLEEIQDVSHTRIVASVCYLDGKQYALVIGGNENNTISQLQIELEDGRVKKQSYDDGIFGVIKLMVCNE